MQHSRPPISFQQALMLEGSDAIVLCRSRTGEGKPFFHYIRVGKEAFRRMHRDYQGGVFADFASYGDVVLSGWGEFPSAEHEKIIKALYSRAG